MPLLGVEHTVYILGFWAFRPRCFIAFLVLYHKKAYREKMRAKMFDGATKIR